MVAVVAVTTGGMTLVDDLLAWPSEPLDELSGLLHTVIFVVAGLAAALWAIVTRWGRVLALSIAAGAVLYHQGLVHLPMLRASRFPTVWPDGLVRLSVAVALAQAVMVAVVVLRTRARDGSDRVGSADPPPAVDRTPAGVATTGLRSND